METPNIPHKINDSTGKITYIVMAYRNLNRNEVVNAVKHYNTQAKRPKPDKDCVIRIDTSYR